MSITHYGLIKLLVCDALAVVWRILGTLFSKEHEQESVKEEEGENSHGFTPNIVEEVGPSSGVHIEKISIDRVVVEEVADPLKEVVVADVVDPPEEYVDIDLADPPKRGHMEEKGHEHKGKTLTLCHLLA